MANGPGVNVNERPDGKWRIRWREPVIGPDGSLSYRQRERLASTKATAMELAAKVLRKVEAGELFEPEAHKVGKTVTVDAVFKAWIAERAGGGVSKATILQYISRSNRVLAAMRVVCRLPDGEAVPASLLTRELVPAISTYLRGLDRLTEQTIHGTRPRPRPRWANATPCCVPCAGSPPCPVRSRCPPPSSRAAPGCGSARFSRSRSAT